MKKSILILLMTSICWINAQTNEQKIITLNGAVTEIVSALGFEKNIIATDVTSTFPTTLKAKDLGHVRNLSIESILSLKPTLVMGTKDEVNENMVSKLKSAGIKTAFFDRDYSIEGTKKLIAEVAEVLSNKNHIALSKKIDQEMQKVKKPKTSKKILFIYARGAGTMMVAGENTPMEKMMILAGGQNAVKGFENFKPLTPEGLISANPDFILLFSSGLESLGGKEGVLKIEGIEKTKAGQQKNIIAIDGALLSGFGPRVGEAVVELNALIYGNGK